MSSRRLLRFALSARFAATAELPSRGGALQHGELSMTIGRAKDELLILCIRTTLLAGAFFYGSAALVSSRSLPFEKISTSDPLVAGIGFVLITIHVACFSGQTFPGSRRSAGYRFSREPSRPLEPRDSP